MTLDELIAIVVALGGISSILTSVVTRAHWAPWLRAVAAVVVSALVGVSGYLSTHDWHVQSVPDLIVLIAGVATGSWVCYQNLFRPLGLSAVVEKATTPSSVLAANSPAPVPMHAYPSTTTNSNGSVTSVAEDGTTTVSWTDPAAPWPTLNTDGSIAQIPAP